MAPHADRPHSETDIEIDRGGVVSFPSLGFFGVFVLPLSMAVAVAILFVAVSICVAVIPSPVSMSVSRLPFSLSHSILKYTMH